MHPTRLTITAQDFLLDGKPLRLLAGALHYFRVPRAYWEDRLSKLRACGFNAVETYIPWNLHEPEEGCFRWEDEYDFPAFLTLAGSMGLYAIVRPSPYICSEWEMGGLPWWLLRKPGLRLRCMNRPYLEAVDRYYDALMPRLVPLQSTHGGPVLMMQIENEYGSYGDDHDYLRYLADGMERRGIDVPLFTSDGGTDFMLTGGGLDGYLKTVNFGSRASENFQKLRERQPDAPLMCAEFWNGWFSHWMEHRQARDPADSARCFRECLDLGAHVSNYMFHGGTNFGWMNGANWDEGYQPVVTSYDDEALLSEAGDYTEKYTLFRNLMREGREEEPLPAEMPKARYGTVPFVQWADLLDQRDQLAVRQHDAAPLTMEELGQGYGFTLYHTRISGPREELPLWIAGLHDRAHILVNGELRAIQYRNDQESRLSLSVPPEGVELDILVENMGRVNYGRYLPDRKGITEGVLLGRTWLFSWDMWPLRLEDLSRVTYRRESPVFTGRPMLLEAEMIIGDAPRDTFVKLPGFEKGVLFVNGRCIGRYWRVGPQQSLYLPAPYLRRGLNRITVLELEGFDKAEVVLDDRPD